MKTSHNVIEYQDCDGLNGNSYSFHSLSLGGMNKNK